MTKQSFKDETDINNIMAKYKNTGLIDHISDFKGSYGDFTNVQEYQLSLNQVLAAQESFEQLPSGIRARFNNSPSALMSFLENPTNLDEAVELGLVNRPTPPPEPKAGPRPASEPPEGATPSTPVTPVTPVK